MFRKSRIALLVAGALFAAHAGAEIAPFDDAIAFDDSASGSQQLTVFNPDGSSYSMTPVELQLADATWSPIALTPLHATVFNSDGTSYSLVSSDMSDLQVAMLEPTLVVVGDEALPDQLTVFEPSGMSYSYEFAPIELTMLEPIEVIAMEDDISISPVALIDEDADLRPTYVAHLVSPPMYTGILEETLS